MKNLQLVTVIGLLLLTFISCGKKQSLNDSSIKRINTGKSNKLLSPVGACPFYKLAGQTLEDNNKGVTKNANASKLKMIIPSVKRPGAPSTETEVIASFTAPENSQTVVASVYFDGNTCKPRGYTKAPVSDTLPSDGGCDFKKKLDAEINKPSAEYKVMSVVRTSSKTTPDKPSDKNSRATSIQTASKAQTEIVQYLTSPSKNDLVQFRYFDSQCNLNSQIWGPFILQNYDDALKLDPPPTSTPPASATPTAAPPTNDKSVKPAIAHQPATD